LKTYELLHWKIRVISKYPYARNNKVISSSQQTVKIAADPYLMSFCFVIDLFKKQSHTCTDFLDKQYQYYLACNHAAKPTNIKLQLKVRFYISTLFTFFLHKLFYFTSQNFLSTVIMYFIDTTYILRSMTNHLLTHTQSIFINDHLICDD